MFGIYLGYFGERHHFYASSGKWVISLGFSSIFTVSKFASPEELTPVLSMIPKVTRPDEFEDYRRDDKGPSREAGAHLIQRMTQFTADAEKIYQRSLRNLDKAKELVSDPYKTKYLSLFEIADLLLPKALKSSNRFPPYALYAVHMALYRNEIVFRPLSPSADCHRRDHIFEVFPQIQVATLNRISTLVREYTNVMTQNLERLSPDELAGSALGNFILRAREKVLDSRRKRSWTPYGTLSPLSETSEVEAVEWSKTSQTIIRYLEWWASYDLFEESSRFHAYGSLILRALDLYPDALLDQSTAWTFLQELGVVQPWEIPSRYRVRFPHVRIVSGGGLERNSPVELESSQREDIAARRRRFWGNMNVFCIDAPSTVIVDDGVSVEHIKKKGDDEYWIHVHVADPASGIKPNSELGKFMELIPENIYLPGHFQAMLPSDLGAEDSHDYKAQSLVERYSLAADRPALSLSAKVNLAGDILFSRVQPAIVQNVKYLNPEDVAEFCNEPRPPVTHEQSLTVGTLPERTTSEANRIMTSTKDLDESSQEELRLLYRLAEALKEKRLKKGAWPFFFPRPSITVSLPETSGEQKSSTGRTIVPADPYIKVAYENSNGCSIVSNSMVLAGEIAAHWCATRGIPIPYRKDVHGETNSTAAYEYATKEIYPLIAQGIEPKPAQRQELARLTGGIELSTTPGPYFMLGLDKYAKVTSPLRRFSDLITHWQIHAGLAHEAKVGRRLCPDKDSLEEILPFTSSTLPHTLSLLQLREKMARTVAHGSKDWILIALIRAWRYENTAPRSMRFTVQSRWRQGVMGRLDFFDLDAMMDVEGIDGKILLRNVKIGDQFDVELENINVHSRQIFVKALNYLGSGDSSGSS